MKLVYFAWVRERVGVPEEEVALPEGVVTVADVIGWLKGRGENYAHAFDHGETIRAARDKAHVAHSAAIAGAKELAFFPPMTGG